MKDSISPKHSSVIGRTIADLTSDFWLFGIRMREQIGKMLIAKGGPWAALAFCFRALENGELSSPKVMLASFRSDGELYKRYSYFIIRNKEEAEKIISFVKESFGL
jgi:hypothetical protein